MTLQDTRTAWDVGDPGIRGLESPELDGWELDGWELDEWELDGWDDPCDVDDPVLGPEIPVPARPVMEGLPAEERHRIIDACVRRELARVLRVPPHEIGTTGRTMNGLGVGSVAGLQLQNRIESALEAEVNLQMLLLANSAQELIDCLSGQLGSDAGHGPRPERRV